MTIGAFAQFLAVDTVQVWKWYDAGVLGLFIPAGNRRAARVSILEARRFYAAYYSRGHADAPSGQFSPLSPTTL